MPKRLVSIIVVSMIVLGFSMLTLGVQLTGASGLVGDINGDGKVDGRDIALIARAFGSYPGHPRWNATDDLNGDGKVNGLDIAIVAMNFGKTTS